MGMVQILLSVIAPIFFLIGVGVVMDRCFRLDLDTLAKLNFYVFVPALLFVKIIEADISGGATFRIIVFTTLHIFILFGAAYAVFSRRGFRPSRTVLSMSVAFSNCGNYGIPFTMMAFGDAAIGPLAAVIMVQNFLVYTFGIWLHRRETHGAAAVLAGLAKIPVIYAILGAVVVRWLDITLIAQVRQPLGYLADGLIPVALLTLGAQLSRNYAIERPGALSAATLLRLAVSPLLAAALAPLFGFTETTATLMIVLAGMPAAVNVYIIAAEYERDRALASQAIFWTTLLSALTLSVLTGIVT